MRMQLALLLVAVFALSPLDGVAGEKQIVDIKELAGSWRGWVAEVPGDEWATMNVSADGSYKASTISGTTVGKFYLQAGNLRYRSKRMTPLAMPSAEVLGTAATAIGRVPKIDDLNFEANREPNGLDLGHGPSPLQG